MKNIELLLNVKKAKNEKVNEVIVSHKWFCNQLLNLNEIQEQVNSILGHDNAEVIISSYIGGKLKSADLKVI